MTRRRLVLLVSAITLGIIGILATSLVLFVTRTQSGRQQLRDRVVRPFIAGKVQGGSVYIGNLSGNFITEITIDSLAIRDKQGELFLSTGRLTLVIDPRDLFDYRFFVRRARVEHPYVHMVRHEDDVWNYKRIFASKDTTPSRPRDPTLRKLGDYIVIDSTYFRGGTFLVTMPWHPDDSLRGAKRDSSIREHLARPEKIYTRRSDGIGRTYRWTNAHGLLTHAMLADPDSNVTVGRRFRVDTLSVDEYEPTFKFRNVSGDIQQRGDSVWFAISHFNMPGSVGRGSGKVWWGSDLPVRYNIAIRGDSVSLDDVNWVYPTLPRTGGGSLNLLIQNDPRNLRVVDFHLRNMDVRSTDSHLTGNMSFGTGGPLLLVRNVELRADPVDFDLIRTLNGKPFPVDWQGQLFGTVRARGGPLARFFVDDARGTFRDKHVPGAESRFTGRGELDIFKPAFTAFHGFNVDVARLDLRTIEYLYPNFPKLGGFVYGTARLDSSWLDVRFSDARLTHQDGEGEPTQVTGSGRVTYGEEYMTYDLTLEAQPLSLTMLARSYPKLPLRGLVSGPIRARGTPADLEVSTSLQGATGALTFEGRLDVDSLSGYGAHGRGQFSALNLGGLLEKSTLPKGLLSGHYDVDVAGETAATLRGTAQLDLERTVVDSVRVYPSMARVRFADGRMKIDSLLLRTQAATVTATGGIGLPKGQSDSMRVVVTVDSLGGLRPFLATDRDSVVTRAGQAVAGVDSLSGTLDLVADARGTLDALDVDGRIRGSDLFYNSSLGKMLAGQFNLRNVTNDVTGDAVLKIDSITVMGLAIDTVGATLQLDGWKRARFAAGALSHNGPTAASVGTWSLANGRHDVTLDSLGLVVGDEQWRLSGAARLSFDTAGVRVDSAVLRNATSGVIALDANVPSTGPASANLRASALPLRDVGLLLQMTDSINGLANVNLTATGTKAAPRLTADARLTGINWRTVDIDSAVANGAYADGRFIGDLNVVRKGQQVATATASIPAKVTLFSLAAREDSIAGRMVVDTTDLSLLKTIIPGGDSVQVGGRLFVDAHATGTWFSPIFDGRLVIKQGSALIPATGVAFMNIDADINGSGKAAGDSIAVNVRASTESEDNRGPGSVQVKGYVKNLFQRRVAQTFSLSLVARELHAFDKRTLANLYISTGRDENGRFVPDSLRLQGSTSGSVLTGNLFVDRGAIYLADREIARKLAVEAIADATPGDGEGTIIDRLSTMMTNLEIRNVAIALGDVRLRSREANVRLVGDLQLVQSTARSTQRAPSGELVPLPELEGILYTAGGTYNLNLSIVQREFRVLPGGTVRFDGPWKNPLLDIRAQYDVKRYGDRDLGVIVNLNGRLLPYPVIDFLSTADYTIAPSDLVSYLLVGKPGFDFGANGQAQQALASVFGPTISVFATDALRQSLGSWVDVVQFQLGSGNSQSANQNAFGGFRDYLYGATLGAEKQYKDFFLNVNTGFCSFGTTQGYDPRQALGAKFEYRPAPKLMVKLAYDPPTSGRVCNQQNFVGLPQTPGQVSFSFAHLWRF